MDDTAPLRRIPTRHRAPRAPWKIAIAGTAVAVALTATIGTIVTVINLGAMPPPATARISTAGPSSSAPGPR